MRRRCGKTCREGVGLVDPELLQVSEDECAYHGNHGAGEREREAGGSGVGLGIAEEVGAGESVYDQGELGDGKAFACADGLDQEQRCSLTGVEMFLKTAGPLVP
jgi:hypothetical protein